MEGLGLTEELVLILDKMGEINNEDIIQSYLYLIREKKGEEINGENIPWDVSSTAVISPKISFLLYVMIDDNLIQCKKNPGYILTEKGKNELLKKIPKEIRKKYDTYIDEITELGNCDEIVKIAKNQFLIKDKKKYEF